MAAAASGVLGLKASFDDLRRIALALPDVDERSRTQGGGVGWRVPRGFVVWQRMPGGRDLQQLAAHPV